jgi:hypothetical protein
MRQKKGWTKMNSKRNRNVGCTEVSHRFVRLYDDFQLGRMSASEYASRLSYLLGH